MNGKDKKSRLRQTIFSGFANLSKDEIKKLIKNEAEKTSDPDFIDFYMDLLESKSSDKRRVKRRRPTKVLLVAAVVAIMIITMVSGTGKLYEFDINRDAVRLVKGNVMVDMSFEGIDTIADGYQLSDTKLLNELADHGITPVTLPEFFEDEECVISDIRYQIYPSEINVFIDFEYEDYSGSLYILYSDESFAWQGDHTFLGVKAGKLVRANGLDILLFQMNYSCSIIYRDNNTNYSINLNGNMDKAIQVAESII